MILIVKAGTDLSEAGEIDMFIAESVDVAVEQWKSAYNFYNNPAYCAPVPASLDVYNVTPFMDDIEVEQ